MTPFRQFRELDSKAKSARRSLRKERVRRHRRTAKRARFNGSFPCMNRALPQRVFYTWQPWAISLARVAVMGAVALPLALLLYALWPHVQPVLSSAQSRVGDMLPDATTIAGMPMLANMSRKLNNVSWPDLNDTAPAPAWHDVAQPSLTPFVAAAFFVAATWLLRAMRVRSAAAHALLTVAAAAASGAWVSYAAVVPPVVVTLLKTALLTATPPCMYVRPPLPRPPSRARSHLTLAPRPA